MKAREPSDDYEMARDAEGRKGNVDIGKNNAANSNPSEASRWKGKIPLGLGKRIYGGGGRSSLRVILGQNCNPSGNLLLQVAGGRSIYVYCRRDEVKGRERSGV